MKYFFRYFSVLLLAACTSGSEYPGYSKDKSGIYFQLHKIGESDVKAAYGDYITCDLVYKTITDSVFFTGRRKLQLTQADFDTSVNYCFTLLSKGDSASFVLPANVFFLRTLETDIPSYIKPNSNLIVTIGIIDIQTELEYEAEKEAFLTWIEDFGDYEKVLLQQFLRQERLAVQPSGSGLVYLKTIAGTGKKVEIGDTVTINYEGKFLNGKFFDSTVRRKQPFQFVYGSEWQVVKGLEEAIGMMCEGEKSIVILPSELAFGTDGSSTGIIPPFTSLIFEVEIVKVN